MLTWWQMGWDGAKLAFQFGGAFAIARLAVHWALRRYKSEKVWERQLAAYADATAAIAEMRRIVGQWFDEAIERREAGDDVDEARRERHRAARRTLDEGTATARLLLPASSAEILTTLDAALSACRNCDTYEEHLDCEWGALDKALDALIVEGRQVLDMP